MFSTTTTNPSREQTNSRRPSISYVYTKIKDDDKDRIEQKLELADKLFRISITDVGERILGSLQQDRLGDVGSFLLQGIPPNHNLEYRHDMDELSYIQSQQSQQLHHISNNQDKLRCQLMALSRRLDNTKYKKYA
jgi:hypothetical protein